VHSPEYASSTCCCGMFSRLHEGMVATRRGSKSSNLQSEIQPHLPHSLASEIVVVTSSVEIEGAGTSARDHALRNDRALREARLRHGERDRVEKESGMEGSWREEESRPRERSSVGRIGPTYTTLAELVNLNAANPELRFHRQRYGVDEDCRCYAAAFRPLARPAAIKFEETYARSNPSRIDNIDWPREAETS